MSQIKQEDVHGIIRNKDTTYTAVMKDGERVTLDKGEYGSLERRLDKDRSRMEREGTRAVEREPEKRYDREKSAREKHERDAQLRRDLARGRR